MEPEQWFAVYYEGQAYAAYPSRRMAEIYAMGFSKPAEIRPLRLALDEDVRELRRLLVGRLLAVDGE